MKRTGSLLALGLSLGGCAGMLNWEAPPERMQAGDPLAEAPIERPMELSPESYRVAKGDTLFSIAFRNNLDYREIARWNGIGADYRIVPGQLLQLTPPPADVAAADQAVAIAPAAPNASAAPPAALPPPRAPATSAPPAPVLPALPVSVGSWQWPTAGPILRSYAPGQGVKGIDFTGRLGQPVVAAAAGRVVYSGNALKGYGELVIVKHDDTHLSAYGYNRKRYVAEGDVVAAGQPIGELGMGPENKPLLHFEIRERGKPVNPATFLPRRRADR